MGRRAITKPKDPAEPEPFMREQRDGLVDGAEIETLVLPPDGREETDMPERSRRDGQPTYEETKRMLDQVDGDKAGEPEAKLGNSYGRAEAEADMAEIRTLNQQISDLQMKVAGIFKAIEKKGGDRRTFKWAYALKYQDPAKSASQIAAFKDYLEWMVEPELAKAASAGSEG